MQIIRRNIRVQLPARRSAGLCQVLALLALIGIFPAQTVGQVTFLGTHLNLEVSGLSLPDAVATDRAGNLFIADQGNNSVVELQSSPSGFGTPITILSGLSKPAGLAIDWSGNLYVSDTGNNRVLMLPASNGGFSDPVVVSSALSNPVGVAVDLTSNVYVADSGSNRIVEVAPIANGYGPLVAIGSGFKGPMGIAVDANKNLYITDTGNNHIVKLAFTAGGYPTQQLIGGTYLAPTGIAIDSALNLYVADTGNRRLFKLPWIGGPNRYNPGTAIGSGFLAPEGVTIDANGNIYAADPTSSSQLVELTASSIDFSAVNVGLTQTGLTFDFGVAAKTTVGSVRVLTQGAIGKDFQDAEGTTCTSQVYTSITNCGVNVAFAPVGSGARKGAIVLYDSQGIALITAFITGTGVEPQAAFAPGTTTRLGGQLSGPSGVAVDGMGNIYIADTGDNRVVELPWTDTGYGAAVTLPFVGLNSPMGLAVDAAGSLYAVSNGNDKVLKLPWTGSGYGQQVKVGTGLYGPSAVALDNGGNVYVTDTLDGQIVKFAWTGTGYVTPGQWLGSYHHFPVGVAVDADNNVFYAMPYTNDLAESPWAGNHYLAQVNFPRFGASFPSALASDGNSNLYMLDTGNNRVLMLPWNGTAFGSPIAVADGFNAPTAMTLDTNGNLYVADTGNNQIVKVDRSVPGPIAFSDTYLGSTSKDSSRNSLVVNIGNQSLTLNSLAYPPDFPENLGSSAPCIISEPISPGNFCALSIKFTPLTVGSPLNESIAFTSNTLGSAGTGQTVPVIGTSMAKLTQTINFPLIANTSYGNKSVALAATATSGLPITFQVVSGAAMLIAAGQSLAVLGAGTIVVQATQSGNYIYAAAPTVTISFVVAPAILTVTPADTTAVYGKIPASFNCTITGYVFGQTDAQVLTGHPAVMIDARATPGVGTYTLVATKGTLSATNYKFVFGTGLITVTAAPLQVIALPASQPYGLPTTAFPWKLSGFVNGDTAALVAGSPLMTPAINSEPAVGQYTITPSTGTLKAANYSFAFVPGVLTVTPAVLRVTAASQTMTYGAVPATLTYAISGFVHGDVASTAVNGTPVIVTAATRQSPTGSYAITVSIGTLTAANYSFSFAPGVLTIQKASLTITPVSMSMTYGSKVPALSFAATGFVNGDTQAPALTGAPLLTTTATSASKPGNFAITAALGSLAAKNYSFNFSSGVLTIAKATLTVTPGSVSIIYGAQLPVFPYNIVGFVNGDGAAVVSGAPIFRTGAAPESPVGQYPITATLGTLVAANYTFSFNGGILTVNKATLVVTANNLSMTKGAAMPALTFAITGFAKGDTAASATTGTPALVTTATANSALGSYPITITQGTMASSGNYLLSFVNGTLTVTQTPGLINVKSPLQRAPLPPVIVSKEPAKRRVP
jgi:sugar lactone lactonase YvrE